MKLSQLRKASCILAASCLLRVPLSYAAEESDAERKWGLSSYWGLTHFSFVIHIPGDPIEERIGCDETKGKPPERVSAEKVFASLVKEMSMTENALVHGEYMRRMKPKDPDAKTALGKWGSSYYTWCMSSDKWKLAKDFLWYHDMKGGPLRFPVMWDKRPELCGERVPALDIEGMTEFVPVKKFEAYLKAAAQWVEPRSLPIEEVLDMLRSDAVEKRIWAVRLLGARKEAEHIPTTAGAFNDDSVEVRRGAAWALGMIGGPAAIEHLQANVGDRWVRADIASALGRIGGPATVEPLARLLRDKHRDVRKHAATAMAATGSEKAIPHLVEALGDEDKPTRQAALESLIQLGWRPPKQGENALP